VVVVVVAVVVSGKVVVACLAAVGLERGLMVAAALPSAEAATCRHRHAAVCNRCHYRYTAVLHHVCCTSVVAKQLEQPARIMYVTQPWTSRIENI
jgi:hypothetical protein